MRRPPTLIQDRRDTGDDWRWFAALMCMCLFIPEFVQTGTHIWNIAARAGYPPSMKPVSIVNWLFLVRSIVFAGTALALVHRSRTVVIWMAALFLLSAIGMTVGLKREFQLFSNSLPTPFSFGTDPSDPVAIIKTIYDWSGQRLPWIAMFAAGVWCRRADRRGVVYRTRTWAIMAAAWCLGDCAVLWSGSNVLCWYFDPMIPRPISLMLIIGLPFALVLTVVLLLKRSRFARTLALLFAGASLAGTCISAYWWCLMHRRTFAYFQHGPYFGMAPWTQSLFDAYFIAPISAVGPWLIIACFARWAPMSNPPEDASPFPRRYCGRCGYNLHALTTTRCPECGETFEPVATAQSEPRS